MFQLSLINNNEPPLVYGPYDFVSQVYCKRHLLDLLELHQLEIILAKEVKLRCDRALALVIFPLLA